jgi:hypothetical protein
MQGIKNKVYFFGILYFVMTVTILSCTKNPKRTFFKNMKRAYSDLKIDSSEYFLKDFGVSSNAEKFKGDFYWRIKCRKGSLFYLSGLIRMIDDSIILVPLDATPFESIQYKLFDFSAATNSSWKTLFESRGNMIYGDSIVYRSVHEEKDDSVFNFCLYPFYFYKKTNNRSYFDYMFLINITKSKGLLNIITVDSFSGDTLFYTTLYPKVKIIDKRKGELRL